MPIQTRHDLEFLARVLGIKVIRGRWEGYPLADEVEIKMADPDANAQARQRISDLRNALPFPGDEMQRAIRNQWPSGGMLRGFLARSFASIESP